MGGGGGAQELLCWSPCFISLDCKNSETENSNVTGYLFRNKNECCWIRAVPVFVFRWHYKYTGPTLLDSALCQHLPDSGDQRQTCCPGHAVGFGPDRPRASYLPLPLPLSEEDVRPSRMV